MITLEEILERTRARLASERPRAAGSSSPSPRRDLPLAIRRRGEFAVIAEIKRYSPSRGAIRPDLDVAELAATYERAGAAALSVLTEPHFFRGSLEDLRRAREATQLPVLCKDFIVDEAQLDAALHHGADAILLIAAALSEATLLRLRRAARERGLAVLIELHEPGEVPASTAAAPELLGVNNRNLRTMRVDVGRMLELAPLLPKTALHVAESGLRTGRDLAVARSAGFDACLIGESLLEQSDPGAALERLRDEARSWSA
jgi:indole-3-glycerol phosphate synthase